MQGAFPRTLVMQRIHMFVIFNVLSNKNCNKYVSLGILYLLMFLSFSFNLANTMPKGILENRLFVVV